MQADPLEILISAKGELLYLNPLLRGPKHLAQAVGQEKFLENSSLVQPSGAGHFLSSTSEEHRTWPSPNFGSQASGAGGWLGWDLFPELWQEKNKVWPLETRLGDTGGLQGRSLTL